MITTTPRCPDLRLSESGSILETTPVTLRNPCGACCGSENSTLTVGANSLDGTPGRYSHALGSLVGVSGILNTTVTTLPNSRPLKASEHSVVSLTSDGVRQSRRSGHDASRHTAVTPSRSAT